VVGGNLSENERQEGQDHPNRTGESQKITETIFSAFSGPGFGGSGPFLAKRIFPLLKAIADTGFLVAFANRKDRYHEWALALAGQVTDPLLTCEAVIAEASFHLQNAWLVLSMIKEGLIRPALSVNNELPHLIELAHRYRDRKPDLADLCIIRMSELYPTYSVITVDVNDFRVYRRNKRERIPIISPQ